MIDFIVQAPHGLACINARDDSGRTPLFYAAASNNHRVLDVLLSLDSIDVMIKRERGGMVLS